MGWKTKIAGLMKIQVATNGTYKQEAERILCTRMLKKDLDREEERLKENEYPE